MKFNKQTNKILFLSTLYLFIIINDALSQDSELFSDKLNLNKLLKTFLNFVITKRRLFYIEKIIEDFIDTCSKNRGEIKADLSSSKELNETEILKIKDELASNFGANIKLNYKYDPSLIGGLIIKVESTMIDTSIKSKLKQLETKMIEA